MQSGLCEALRQDMGYLFCKTEINNGQQRLEADEAEVQLLRSLLNEVA